uniref:Uncharacterized protein n=1 Tax=Leptospira ellisii TaxID=2023197 RepID=A0A2N0B2Q2_9LEPT|nr:hypothetical protein CH379_22295 [Leptospira ellisii]
MGYLPDFRAIQFRFHGDGARLNHIPILSLNHAQFTVGEYVHYYNLLCNRCTLNKRRFWD